LCLITGGGVSEKMRALAAHKLEHLADIVKQVTMEDRLDQLYLPEMAWTVHLGAPAGLAKTVFVHGSHQVVIDAPTDRITVRLIRIV
jgi:hypothetical protein